MAHDGCAMVQGGCTLVYDGCGIVYYGSRPLLKLGPPGVVVVGGLRPVGGWVGGWLGGSVGFWAIWPKVPTPPKVVGVDCWGLGGG